MIKQYVDPIGQSVQLLRDFDLILHIFCWHITQRDTNFPPKWQRGGRRRQANIKSIIFIILFANVPFHVVFFHRCCPSYQPSVLSLLNIVHCYIVYSAYSHLFLLGRKLLYTKKLQFPFVFTLRTANRSWILLKGCSLRYAVISLVHTHNSSSRSNIAYIVMVAWMVCSFKGMA